MLDYRILGPLEVSADGRVIEIGGAKPRALLVILLLRANESVPRDVLMHELWGDQPPASAQHSLEVYVSRLRKSLDGAANGSVLVTGPGAYRLRVEAGQLDTRRFEQLVEQGRAALAANQPDQASASLRAALELWRGPALADLVNGRGPRVEAARLEELRLVAIEDRVDTDLALGRHAEVACELEVLVAAHPLRERLHGQLMIALYRGGRQAEALEGYQAARRTLVDELGLEPGPELRELEGRILRHDPALTSRPAPVPADGPSEQAARIPGIPRGSGAAFRRCRGGRPAGDHPGGPAGAASTHGHQRDRRRRLDVGQARGRDTARRRTWRSQQRRGFGVGGRCRGRRGGAYRPGLLSGGRSDSRRGRAWQHRQRRRGDLGRE